MCIRDSPCSTSQLKLTFAIRKPNSSPSGIEGTARRTVSYTHLVAWIRYTAHKSLLHIDTESTRICNTNFIRPFRSEEHTSELQSHSEISYAVFCLKKPTWSVYPSSTRKHGTPRCFTTVSYTHLDVYKRQVTGNIISILP